jgi:hypothetical protein
VYRRRSDKTVATASLCTRRQILARARSDSSLLEPAGSIGPIASRTLLRSLSARSRSDGTDSAPERRLPHRRLEERSPDLCQVSNELQSTLGASYQRCVKGSPGSLRADVGPVHPGGQPGDAPPHDQGTMITKARISTVIIRYSPQPSEQAPRKAPLGKPQLPLRHGRPVIAPCGLLRSCRA